MLSVHSDIQTPDPSLVQIFAYQNINRQYFNVAFATSLFYDTLVKMDKEVKYFWRSPQNLVSFLYYVNRYVGILGAASSILYQTKSQTIASCQFSYWTNSLSRKTSFTSLFLSDLRKVGWGLDWTTFQVVDYILLMRVLALYCQDRRAAFYLKALFTMEAVSRLAITLHSAVYVEVTVGRLAEDYNICTQRRVEAPVWVTTSSSIPLVYGVILTVLALYKAAEFWRTSEGLTSSDS